MARSTTASDGFDPRRLIGVTMAGVTLYQVWKGKRVSPLAVLTAAITLTSFIADL